ncbi:MAG: type II toxin-antitoxin system VapC family toxin [Spirochaetales bacterium]|nr:type II toxin-antitoxin system VapC family toxin [Spirochaetales bacterium]
MFLLDTNICIYAIKKKSDLVLDNISINFKHGIYISALTVAELEFGIADSQYPEENRLSLLEFLSIFTVLPFDDDAAIPYGKIKKKLKEEAKIIGPIDLLLAAQAISKNLIFVTNNTKEFQRIKELRIALAKHNTGL